MTFIQIFTAFLIVAHVSTLMYIHVYVRIQLKKNREQHKIDAGVSTNEFVDGHHAIILLVDDASCTACAKTSQNISAYVGVLTPRFGYTSHVCRVLLPVDVRK